MSDRKIHKLLSVEVFCPFHLHFLCDQVFLYGTSLEGVDNFVGHLLVILSFFGEGGAAEDDSETPVADKFWIIADLLVFQEQLQLIK